MTPPLSRGRRWARIAPALVAAAAVGMAGIGGTLAAFTSTAHTAGNDVAAAEDFRAPAVEAGVILRSGGSVPGFAKQAGTYHVYARVAADAGAPAAGIATVTADVSGVTAGGATVPLLAGSYSVGGASYNYRSAPLVANAVLSEGPTSYSITATDNASNAATLSGLSVTVDNSAPSAADVQTANTGGGTVGRPQLGDTLMLTFSEPIDPATVLSGWGGGSTNVVVRMTNGGLLGLGTDDVEVRNAAGSATLPLGRIDLGRSDYVTGLLGGETVSFGAGGTASTMAMDGNDVTITLGSASGSGSAATAGGNGTASWAPSATPTDRAGNLSSPAAANESGVADKEF
ncbi:MAG TPA: SipW-dependent-type signal peptide-containing protein [Solirubrobacteraceae bacterium]|nr:SipW-dependent-type signal peptide-containing protein [Solirubrobacteraceae bacterium]